MNYFPASAEFFRLRITFAKSLEPDQARQNVGHGLVPDCLTLWNFFMRVNLKKKSTGNKKHARLTSMLGINLSNCHDYQLISNKKI